jgi:hypothetical protein
MRKKTAATILAAGLVTGGGAALFVPSVALAADAGAGDQSATDRAATRLTAIKDALKGLVSDGTITQAQADKVAGTLAESGLGGPGGRGGHGRGGWVSPEATAKVIGITVDQLRTAQQSGQTLAQIAEAHGVSKADLIKGLVEAAETQLAADVKAGKLTQAQADQITSDLTTRVTERVDRTGRGFGPGGGGPGGGPGNGRSAPTTPTPTATTS